MAEKKVKLSERTHPLYDENKNKWELYESAAKGGPEFMSETNILKHRLEDSDDYQERLDRAFFLNYCDTIPRIYNSYIFKESIERKPDTTLEKFRENADGNGRSITEFVKRAGYLASVYGVVHILVDIPPASKSNPSKADIKYDGITPYCVIILPTQLKDWSVDARGDYNWILIESEYYNDDDPTKEREESMHYKLITRESWEVQDEDGKAVKYEDGTESKGENKLGIIPIYSLYHTDVDDDKIGESLIKDIVYTNRTILNWCSCIDEEIERHTFSQLVVPDDGSLNEPEGQDALRKIGTSSVWTYWGEAKNPPAFIAPDSANLAVVWNLIEDLIKEMFRMAGLQGGTSDLYSSRSGRQSQMSFLGVNSSLAEKSMTYERAENMVSMLAYLQLGANLEEFEPVKYPSTFDVVSLAEEVDGMLKVMERNFSPTFNKTLMKNIARKAVPFMLTETADEIEKEIDSGDGIVNTVSKGNLNPEQEANGDGNPNSSLEESFKSRSDYIKNETANQKQ